MEAVEVSQPKETVEVPAVVKTAEPTEPTIKIEDILDETMVDASAVSEDSANDATKQETADGAQPSAPKDGSVETIIKVEAEDTPMPAATGAPPGDGSVKAMVTEDKESAEVESKASVPKLKEGAKDDLLMMPPPLSPAVLQKCRPSILDLDPNVTIFSLDTLEAQLEGVHIGAFDVNALFPDLPLYGPPNPDDNDAYLDEAEHGRVTMISRLMTSKPPLLEFGPLASQVVYLKRMREPTSIDDDFDDEDARVPKIEGKILTALPGTEPPRIVPVLFQPKKSKDPPMTPIRRPTPPGPLAAKNTIVWTSEEDELLTSLIKPYQFNWDLIADIFNSMRGPIISSERRTPWDCYEKWSKKDGPQSGGSSSGAETGSGLIPIGNLPTSSGSTPSSPKARKDKDGKKIVTSIKVDPARKKQRSLSLLEAMKKTAKKREAVQIRVNAGKVWF